MATRRTRASAIVTLGSPAAPNPSASPDRIQHIASNNIPDDLINRLAEALKNGHTHMSLLPEEAPDASEDMSSDNGDSETANPPVPQRTQPTHRDPKIAPPETFDGKPAKFDNFITQCALHITVRTNTFRTEEQRVLFVISCLRGEPLTWAREIVKNRNNPLRHNYEAFEEALTNIYGNRAYKLQAEDKILRLSQTGSASHYAQTFQALAAPLDLNEGSKCTMFYNGLKPEVKRAIITSGRPSTLPALINQAVMFDQLFFQQRNQEKRAANSESSPSHPSKRRRNDQHGDNRENNRRDDRHRDNRRHNQQPEYQRREQPEYRPREQTAAPPDYSRENKSFRPTSMPRDPLTDAQRAYRKANGLCAYCGASGHDWHSCPRHQGQNKPKPTAPFRPTKPTVAHLENEPTLMYPVPIRPSTAPPTAENWRSQPPRTSES
jgi:hypothetical protein